MSRIDPAFINQLQQALAAAGSFAHLENCGTAGDGVPLQIGSHVTLEHIREITKRGNHLLTMDRFNEAERLFRMALELSERYFPNDVLEAIPAVNGLSRTLFKAGKFDELDIALKKGLDLLNVLRQQMGPDS